MLQNFSFVVGCHILKVIVKVICLLIKIIPFQGRVIHDGIISAKMVKAESRWRIILIIVYNSKKRRFNFRILTRIPQHLHCFFIYSLIFILVIYSPQEESIESHLREQGGLRILVAERIKVPPNVGCLVESIKYKKVAQRHLVYNVFVISCRLLFSE